MCVDGSPGLSQCVYTESWQIRVKKDKGDLSKLLPQSKASELQLRIHTCVYMFAHIIIIIVRTGQDLHRCYVSYTINLPLNLERRNRSAHLDTVTDIKVGKKSPSQSLVSPKPLQKMSKLHCCS